MKITAKPISSPGRAEKFPPPLMRFLRTNVGSRSRGRSKSSPMFLKKRGSTAIETQEPTSPKVTCMGQVRVSRSKKKPDPTRKPPRLPKKPCFSIPPLFCPRYKWKKLKPKCSISAWFKWVSCCRVVSGRKVESREDSMRKDLSPVNKRGDNYTLNKKREDSVEEEDEDDQEEEEVRVYESSCFTTPPKNALLLTRCRSAPYRSSSLASRFWDSPLKDEGNTEQENKAPLVGDNKVLNLEEEEESNPMSRKDSENDEEEKERFLKGIESTIRERMIKSANDKKECEEEGGGREEEEEEDGSVSRRPLILTRCKSEPARTASKKLDPEMNFWRKRRLESAASLSPHAI